MATDHLAATKTPARILKYLCPNIYRWPNVSYVNERMNAVYIYAYLTIIHRRRGGYKPILYI